MNSLSIGTGKITEGGLTFHRNSSAAAHERPCSHDDENRHQSSDQGREDPGVFNDSKPPDADQSIIGYEEPIMLTQSTNSFLFTEPSCSVPFIFALLILSISYTCLILALYNNVFRQISKENLFSVPGGVTLDVTFAQYLALLIGLLMEEEIPESLYLLRMITERTLHNKEPTMKYGQFIFCAMLRIIMGYLFYLNMFTVVAQATAVIDIFYDVMALQFLQQVDDIAFRLAKIDVFGKRLKKASTRKCFRAEFEKLPFARRKKVSIFMKGLYMINFCALMAGMAVVTIKQRNGGFHCHSITVTFDDHIWVDALVFDSTGDYEGTMDLFYSYFNGVYVKSGTHHGRPIYIEQNKFDGAGYKEKTGAVIKYCNEERAWVFMHEKIRKDNSTKDSDCPWLLRSPETDSFTLLEVSGNWDIWTGTISNGANFQASCNSCNSQADCNYHGECASDGSCVCDINEADGYNQYNGIHCELARPCVQLRGLQGDLWNIIPVNACYAWGAYGRTVYTHYSGGNMTIAGTNDEVILVYSGSRWLTAVFKDGVDKERAFWLHFATELHAFWDRLYTKKTAAVSDPTSRTDPIAVDFFKIGRRGEKYGPLGELLPAQDPPGSGYFECAPLNMSLNAFVADVLEVEGGCSEN